MPSPGDMLMHIDRRLGRLEGNIEMGFSMTNRAITAGFAKSDHAHARITRLKQRVEGLESGSLTAGSSRSPTGWAGLLSGPTRFLTALATVLPPLGTLALLMAWLTVALTVGINAETLRALIGLTP